MQLPPPSRRKKGFDVGVGAAVQALLNAAPEARRACHLYLILTGLRRSEAARLRWDHLDAANAYVKLSPDLTKSGKAETVPLLPDVVRSLNALRAKAQDGDLVFDEIPSMEDFRLDLAAAGIEEEDARGRKVVLHSLRHSLCTMLAISNVPMVIAQRIMRHRGIKLTAEAYLDEGLLPLQRRDERAAAPHHRRVRVVARHIAQLGFPNRIFLGFQHINGAKKRAILVHSCHNGARPPNGSLPR